MHLFLVALGGAAGALLRFGLHNIVPFAAPFPLSTLLANYAGTLLLSYLTFSILHRHKNMMLFLGTGVLGSFTSVSAFSMENITLFQSHAIYSLLYTGSTVAGGIFFAWSGFKLAEIIQMKGTS
ncbi:CrcB family protein [Jeotgalibacillus sp. S-D1]|uniref:fluoride efflux transporter FluC n=1 Tax=Jeotgalibacillus sp. S-D1 TaxID=2552189 RepID=UPI0010F184D8|nr:CrcB family protein [Jeotgalibacillus sp. S-D1]TDL34871.1 CrcB family protein [Jeotgalibacillus sp. S-D1]